MPAVKRKLTAREVAACFRVREQLAELRRSGAMETNFTIQDYKRMDPMYLSTMTGACTGRVVEFPKMDGMTEAIKRDLRKWPWRKRNLPSQPPVSASNSITAEPSNG